MFIISRELYDSKNNTIVSPLSMKEYHNVYKRMTDRIASLVTLSETHAQFFNDFIDLTSGEPQIESNTITQLYNEALEETPNLTQAEFAKLHGIKYEDGDWVITTDYKFKILLLKNLSNLIEVPEELLDILDMAEEISPVFLTLGNTDTPIGYIKMDGKYVINKEFGQTIQSYIQEYKALLLDDAFSLATIEREIQNLEHLYSKYLKNTILETMLTLITSKKSRERMLAPISFAPLENAYESLPAHLKKDNKKLDLSLFEDEFAAFSSLGSGQVLTGAFANSIKVFAYLLRAGSTEDLTELLQKYREEPTPELLEKIKVLNKVDKASVNSANSFSVIIDGIQSNFNKLRVLDVRAERDLAKGYSVTEVFDALVNAAIDNLNKQLISKMNINTYTGSAVTGMVSLGLPMDIIQKILFTQVFTPVLNNEINNINEFIKEVKTKYANELALVKDSILTDTELSAALELSQTAQKKEDDLNTSLKAFLIFEKAHKIGEDMRNLASFLNIIRKFDVTPEGLDRIQANLSTNIGTIVNLNDKYLLKPNEGFSFIAPNLLESSPHIQEAYATYMYIQNKVKSLFKIHSEEYRNLAELVKSGVKFARDEEYYAAKELSNIRTSLAHYLMSNLVWDDVIKTPQLERKIEGTSISYLPSLADSFSDSVLKDIQALKSYVNTNGIQNTFLNHVSIKKDDYGRFILVMNLGVNMAPEDIKQVMVDFIKLNRFSVKNGVVSHSLPTTEYELTPLHRRLLIYNVVKYGISYAGTGMSQIMPADLFRDLDRQFNDKLDTLSSLPNIAQIIDHFRFSYILQNASRIPFSAKEDSVYQTIPVGEFSKRTVFSGVDFIESKPIYFDRKLFTKKDKTGKIIAPNPFIKISVGKKTRVFKLVLTTPDYAYYQTVGNVAEVFYSPVQKGWAADKVFNAEELTFRSQGSVINNTFKTKEYIDHLIEEGTVAWVTPTYSFDRSERVLVRFTSKDYKTEGSAKFPVFSYKVEVIADKLASKYLAVNSEIPFSSAVKKTINVYWGQAESDTSTRLLSNLAPRPFIWEGVQYGSVEHAYQTLKAGKFDQETYDRYVAIGGYGAKIRGKGTLQELKQANSLSLMKKLVVESFKQNPNSQAAIKLLQYDSFTHNTNELIDRAFLEGLLLAKLELSKPNVSVKSSTSFEQFATKAQQEIDRLRTEYTDEQIEKIINDCI